MIVFVGLAVKRKEVLVDYAHRPQYKKKKTSQWVSEGRSSSNVQFRLVD